MKRQRHPVTLEQGYAIWAETYDTEENPLILTEEPRVEALLQTIPFPQRVLDVAAGTGRWAVRFARAGAEVTALDQSAEMLAVARNRARAEGLSITFIEGSIANPLPVPPEHFDLVICALALCHVPDLAGAVAGCARALRPGGYLLITDFHPQAVVNGWETTVLRDEDAYVLPNARHSRATYLDAVKDAGCQLVHVEEVPAREQPREAILWDGDVEEFLRLYGDWPFCLIVLAQRLPEPHEESLA